jgi:protein SCO1/2
MSCFLKSPGWACLLGLLAATPAVRGQVPPSSILERVGFDQKLGAAVPLDLVFRDETGAATPLGAYFHRQRPVLLALVYYNCPMLCTEVLNGLTRSLRPLRLELGSDYEVVTVSIDPKDTPELARLKKRNYLERYGRGGGESGWHFLTGTPSAIEPLAEAVGFRYDFNPATGQYAHAAGIVILTPDGRVARYLYGIDFPMRDIEFGLMEAAAGRVGTPIAKLLLLCYDYDAASGRYTLSILRLTRVLGIGTVLAVAGLVTWLVRREHHHSGLAVS